LDPVTSTVIDKLIKEITVDLKTTTVINTHDMNSVMDYGDHVIYLHKGLVHWEGTPEGIKTTEDEILKEFIYASEFARTHRQPSGIPPR
jgi:phospholipid/cholesterol/gamma-HCH transport system ATP-binding protein